MFPSDSKTFEPLRSKWSTIVHPRVIGRWMLLIVAMKHARESAHESLEKEKNRKEVIEDRLEA